MPSYSAEEFGYASFEYLLSPAWHAQKKYNQTHNVDGERQAVYAPINFLHVAQRVARPGSELFVTPNVNVIYGSAHLDLSQDVVFVSTQPNIDDQYCIWECMDAFMNVFAYIGSTKTPGTDGPFYPVGDYYAFMYEGDDSVDLPDGYIPISCPTRDVWVVTRYFVQPDNPDDVVNLLLNSCPLGPSGNFPSSNAIYHTEPPQLEKLNITKIVENDEVDTQVAIDMYTQMNEWLTRNGWGPAEDYFKTAMREYGLGPNEDVDWVSVFGQYNGAIEKGILAASARIDDAALHDDNISATVDHWRYSISSSMGDYGTKYLLRSVIARVGLGANKLSQCVYPATYTPDGDSTLNSENRYELTIPKEWFEDLPYVEPGFWSITVYDLESGTLPYTDGENYATIYQPGPTLERVDGQDAVVVLSKKPPSDEGVNWLPLPYPESKDFYLIMRVYGPDPKMVGSLAAPPSYPWRAPSVREL